MTDRPTITPESAEALRRTLDEVARGTLVGQQERRAADDQLAALHAESNRLLAMLLAVLTPAQSDVDELIDDMDRALLDAFNRGVLRADIPALLSLTKRQVDDRLRRLRELTGSQTPFQLGRAAQALGWLTGYGTIPGAPVDSGGDVTV